MTGIGNGKKAAALGIGAAAAGMLAAYKLVQSSLSMTRKPEGRLGAILLKSMNSGHAMLADWGLSQLTGTAPEAVLDAGCGGGRNAAALLEKYPDAVVTAIDYSPLCVQKAREYNSAAVAAGRCDVLEGDVRRLGFAEGSFELVTAFETVYFWPGVTECFAEICRVVRPGGTFAIVNESDGEDAVGKFFAQRIEGMRCYTQEQLAGALRAAGFASVQTLHHTKRPWIMVIARKAD